MAYKTMLLLAVIGALFAPIEDSVRVIATNALAFLVILAIMRNWLAKNPAENIIAVFAMALAAVLVATALTTALIVIVLPLGFAFMGGAVILGLPTTVGMIPAVGYIAILLFYEPVAMWVERLRLNRRIALASC